MALNIVGASLQAVVAVTTVGRRVAGALLPSGGGSAEAAELERLRRRVAGLEQRLERVESRTGEDAPTPADMPSSATPPALPTPADGPVTRAPATATRKAPAKRTPAKRSAAKKTPGAS